jgi:tetraacyldisaccharide 4'-kinase
MYGRIAQRRRTRLLQQRDAASPIPVPVVVVGNISIGGTGKTPFVIWLVEQLRQWGWSPGVVSRGYGGRAPSYPHRVTATDDPAVCGDEPLLIARRTGVPLFVDPDRRRAVAALLAQGGVDIIVTDDGLQHYRLPRDFEICVVDGRRGLGNGWLLPAGPLRELPARLDAVGLVVVNGEGWSPPDSIPHLVMKLALEDAWPLRGGVPLPLFRWRGQKVHAVAGIGHPQRFFDALAAEGLLIEPHPFPDHHAFSAADLDFGDDLPVLMTEKDAMKCLDFAPAAAWAVPASAQIDTAAGARVQQSLQSLKRTG